MKLVSRNIKVLISICVIICLLIVIGVTSQGRENMTGAENIVGTILSLPQKVMFNIGHTLSNAFVSVQDVAKTNEENEILKETLYKLKEENRVLKNIVNNSSVLEAEYNLKMNLTYDYVVGQVIAKDDSSWFSRFTIDKGSNDGIKKNDIVIQAIESDDGLVQIGLVGVVSEVGFNWAKVVTIIDESCKVSFKDLENNESGIISGSADGEITGFFLDNKATAESGDDLVTSGIGNIYLKDIYIGKVTDVIPTTDATSTKIFVEPVIDFTKLYKVFVLKINR